MTEYGYALLGLTAVVAMPNTEPPLDEPGHRPRPLVRVEFGVGQPAVVVDDAVHEDVAGAA